MNHKNYKKKYGPDFLDEDGFELATKVLGLEATVESFAC